MNNFIWLLRREWWESRSIWLAPMICAAIVTLVSVFGILHSGHLQVDPDVLAKLSSKFDPTKRDMYVAIALFTLGVPFFITVVVTQALYALDALFTERRDRSVLFWKSLPLSDTQTVLAKLVTASVVMPLVGIAAMLVSQLIVMFVAGVAVTLPAIMGPATSLWSPAAWGAWLAFVGYIFVAATFWFLPTIAFLMLVSAWAPRSPFAIATLAPLAVMLVERIAFGTNLIGTLVMERTFPPAFLAGAFGHHMTMGGGENVQITLKDMPASIVDIVDPLRYFTSPEVWIGVLLAMAMVGATIWLRRYRDSTV